MRERERRAESYKMKLFKDEQKDMRIRKINRMGERD